MNNNMTPEQQRIAIAEALGWTFKEKGGQLFSYHPTSKVGRTPHTWELPDYLNDLNAMHKAEKVLNPGEQCHFSSILIRILGHEENGQVELSDFNLLHATAAQRAEAFLRTIGRWVES